MTHWLPGHGNLWHPDAVKVSCSLSFWSFLLPVKQRMSHASKQKVGESLAENRSLMIENWTGAAKDMLSDATKLQILEEPLHKEVVLKPSTEWDLARSRYWICHWTGWENSWIQTAQHDVVCPVASQPSHMRVEMTRLRKTWCAGLPKLLRHTKMTKWLVGIDASQKIRVSRPHGQHTSGSKWVHLEGLYWV